MILIYTKNISSRFKYTLNIIFREVLSTDFLITDDYKLFIKSTASRINYSEKKIEHVLQIIPSGLLEENGIREQAPKTGYWNALPVIFANKNRQVPFDLLSAVFYLVTRYEEYLPNKSDIHGRFEAHQSISAKNKFLRLPVIDLWCKKLAEILGIEQECRGIHPSNYKFQMTIDIDQAWYYKNYSRLIVIGRLLKQIVTLNFSGLILQLQVLTNFRKDPADTFKYLSEIKNRLSAKMKFFILSGARSKYDSNNSVQNENFKNFIKDLNAQYDVGMHPSYVSNNSFQILTKEYRGLADIIGSKIKMSRQHFLILKMPDTYRNLIKLEIDEDYTMGYASQTGFRSGIARPFYFYDLIADEQTNLRIFPFEVMDRTLQKYMKYDPHKAIEEIDYYRRAIASVGGLFVCLWHNTSLSDLDEWKGWRSVFESMIRPAM